MIERIPDGSYPAGWYVHDDGIDHGLEVTIRVAVTIDGDRARFDFMGTDPQVRGNVNAPLAVTLSPVMIAFSWSGRRDASSTRASLRRPASATTSPIRSPP